MVALLSILHYFSELIMITPAGFELEEWKDGHVQPIEAMFNPSFIVRSFHVITTAGMTMAFVIASIAAFKLLRNRQPKILSTGKKSFGKCL